MFILAGVLAFDVLQRLTGDWTVMDSAWMQDFANPMILKTPLIWFLINMAFWFLVAFVCVKVLTLLVFATQGTTVIRVRIMQKIILVSLCSRGGGRQELFLPPRACSILFMRFVGDLFFE